jgi:CMP-N-acetylneuraminic acid synthetase
MECVAIVPARGGSSRVRRKNIRPFWRGLSLVDVKLRMLTRCHAIDRTIVSSDDPVVLDRSQAFGAEAVRRPSHLCGDHVNLSELFREVLGSHRNRIVYWAHPTSPFVEPATVVRAVTMVREIPERCVLGVERLQSFVWEAGRPLNYDPAYQPRTQDLPPIWRVTGGIHVALGDRFIREGALAFEPVSLLEMSRIESLDIDTEEDWTLCSYVADRVLPQRLD